MRYRITEYVKDGIVQLNPAQDKVMLCGSMESNKDMTQLLLERGFEEGNRRTAGTFVLERAFVS